MKHFLSFSTTQIVGILLLVFTIGCATSGTKELTETQRQSYLAEGDSISSHAQKILLANVSRALEERGAPGAVEFCNEKAVFLTDSASNIYEKKIQRLTDKNRNPNNFLASFTDHEAWQHLSKMMEDKEILLKHVVEQEGNNVYYYKAIPLGMPTCLSCHGTLDGDITSETHQMIQSKYPTDKATGYKMGDLRGMWKIKLN